MFAKKTIIMNEHLLASAIGLDGVKRGSKNITHNVNTNTISEEPIKVSYIGVGVGGSSYYETPNNPGVLTNRNLLEIDLKKPIPVMLRVVGDTITDEEVFDYRLRTTETINGVAYVAYWLIHTNTIHTASVNSNICKVTSRGVSGCTEMPLSNLTSIIDTVGDDKVYCKTTAAIRTGITSAQANEIRNVLAIYYPDTTNRVISEIGLYMGREISGDLAVTDCDLAYGISNNTPIVANNPVTISCDIAIGDIIL